MKTQHFAAISALLSGVSAFPTPDLLPRAACAGNTAADRSVWCDYSISTDWYTTTPDTGVTREYWFEVTNTTAAPDGVERHVMTINGTIPGPAIIADWGDTVIVHLTNSLENNGTGLHFHGLHQKETFQSDGVPSITQCPVAPGDTITYKWKATNYGSSWYHSHFSLQAWDGVFGPIVINGPASANYDEDLGLLFLNDWSHITADVQEHISQTQGPPTQDNGLINGTNTYEGLGSRFNLNIEAGKTYRLRLVNAAIDTLYNFGIDNHNLTVIAADFVPIVPYSTSAVAINMGQRYDVLFTANQDSKDYWMRSLPCNQITNSDGVQGILRYDSASTSDPSTTSTVVSTNCAGDEPLSSLVPYVSKDAGDADTTSDLDVSLTRNSRKLLRWQIGNTTMITDWANPSIEKAANGNFSFTDDEVVISLPNANTWIYLVIQNTGVVHPIHLHGHDFSILAQGTGSATMAKINTSNPPRRDTATLPSNGHLVLAFETDNPGIWLMHCHIGYHTFEGFGLQFVERESELVNYIDANSVSTTCANWDSWVQANNHVQDESGI